MLAGVLSHSISAYSHSMSGVSLDTSNVRRQPYLKDFCVATPEEFVKAFGGDVIIKKVE